MRFLSFYRIRDRFLYVNIFHGSTVPLLGIQKLHGPSRSRRIPYTWALVFRHCSQKNVTVSLAMVRNVRNVKSRHQNLHTHNCMYTCTRIYCKGSSIIEISYINIYIFYKSKNTRHRSQGVCGSCCCCCCVEMW